MLYFAAFSVGTKKGRNNFLCATAARQWRSDLLKRVSNGLFAFSEPKQIESMIQNKAAISLDQRFSAIHFCIYLASSGYSPIFFRLKFFIKNCAKLQDD